MFLWIESLCICYYLSVDYFVCENARDTKQTMIFHCVYLQKKIRIKKTMFKNDLGFKKYKNVKYKH